MQKELFNVTNKKLLELLLLSVVVLIVSFLLPNTIGNEPVPKLAVLMIQYKSLLLTVSFFCSIYLMVNIIGASFTKTQKIRFLENPITDFFILLYIFIYALVLGLGLGNIFVESVKFIEIFVKTLLGFSIGACQGGSVYQIINAFINKEWSYFAPFLESVLLPTFWPAFVFYILILLMHLVKYCNNATKRLGEK